MKKLLISCSLLLACLGSSEQETNKQQAAFISVKADSSFLLKSRSFQWAWGHNRRKEWAQSVPVPLLFLDQFPGQLIPYTTGGGNESNTLRLRTKEGKEYVLRSIRKSRKDVIAPQFRNTFVADIINDGISCSYPYAPFAIAKMESAAGIPHPIPELVWLPQQPALDSFNNRFANALYLFEQRPEGDWSDAGYLGNFSDFSGTDNVIEKILDDNRKTADQFAFLKARLFDMLIGDWDRHEDNWRWGKRKENGLTTYVPVPRDRDQAFFTHNGFFIDPLLPAVGLSFMQDFDAYLRNPKQLNFEERNIDRLFTNQLSLPDWQRAATELQQSLTDAIIDQSVHDLPPEIFAISGKELIEKIKSRRDQLVGTATSYYSVIANEVEIAGSREKELFEVEETTKGETSLNIYRFDSAGSKEINPFYSRTFDPGQTKELRIFGMGAHDVFMIRGHARRTKLRIIGGLDKDSIVQQGNKIRIYDDRNNNSITSTNARIHYKPDSIQHTYRYGHFNYDTRGFVPNFFFDQEDRVYIGLNYSIRKYNWRREPYGSQHTAGINYSISQRAIDLLYSATYPQLLGKWDLGFNVNYDPVRWTNFYGIGNETVLSTRSREFYQLISRELFASIGIRRRVGKNNFNFSAFFDGVRPLLDTGRSAAKFFPVADSSVFVLNYYAGLRFIYSYVSVDDSIVPTKGISLLAKAEWVYNWTQRHLFQDYSLRIGAYIPIGNHFSFAITGSAKTFAGNSSLFNSIQVMQQAVIGGPETLRGYRMQRFWGKSAYYNNNELRYHFSIHSYVLNAKAGLLTFFDNGRVWVDNDPSSKIHTAYGGGIFLAPFNQLCLTLTYGISPESRLVQLRINTLF